MDQADLQSYIDRLHELDQEDLIEVSKLIGSLGEISKREKAQDSFLDFVYEIWPQFISGYHHGIMATAFERVATGKLKRLIINLPPRHTKSEFASHLFPAWFMGKYPSRKIIQATHTAELSKDFGRKTKDTIDSEAYQKIFPNVGIKKDNKAAGRWNTNQKGEYYAVGTEGGIAGRGADLFIIDDPHNEKDVISNPKGNFEKIYNWYTSGPRQRLQPNGALVIVQCVAEGERVLMSDGRWVPIEDVKPDDSVISYDGGRSVSRKVLGQRLSGEDDLVEVVSRSCSLRVNRNHPFMVVRGGLKKSPKTQDEVVKSRDWFLEWVKAGDLTPGDTVVTMKMMESGIGSRPMSYSSSIFKEDVTQMVQDDYWLFGFMFGDGWIVSCRRRGDVGFCVAKSDKPDLDAKFLGIIERRLGVNMKETKFGYYRADCAPVARWLVDRGFSSGAHSKRVPEWVFRLRVADKRKFLEGFFAADGWLRPSVKPKTRDAVRTYSVGLCNRELLDDLRLLARTCGYRTTKIYEYEYNDVQPPNSPVPITTMAYTARFTDKHRRLELVSRYKNQLPDHCNNNQHFRFEDIECINDCGRSNVYDLSVEGSENFVAEGYVVHNTRWGKADLTGRILQKAKEDGDLSDWEVIELPAIMDNGNPIWPEFWSLKELKKLEKELPSIKWKAQYLQQPTASDISIIKRDDWRPWKHPNPPQCEFVIQSWDTGFKKSESSDPSAFTEWGVFYTEGPSGNKMSNIILLDAFKKRMEFPELKEESYQRYKRRSPDLVIIEAKSSGLPLLHELRLRGLPVQEYTPTRGNDKTVRVNAVSDLFSSGVVWYPEGKAFAEDVIDEFADFPGGTHDDLVDSGTQALIRFRQGGFITLDSDQDYEDDFEPIRANYY